ncbi:MAG TPA: HD domain-containing protein [Chthoniobacterales bacterium]|jgi:guanosine-3',5'-bis(diphosphate) 3'-pyrophosphohydrolase|nr:HD domain-containing protein [Chthoniobacterales bacterium]
MADLLTFVAAADFAARKHRHQRRKDEEASPYINHTLAVANLLAAEAGIRDPVTLCAAVLHDTIEDTHTTATELEQTFGAQITHIVVELTDDKALPKHVRKLLQIEHAPHLSRHAKTIRLADKICNLRDDVISPPVGWSIHRCREYFEWAGKVVDSFRGTHPTLESLFDQVYAQGIACFDEHSSFGGISHADEHTR